MTLPDIAPPLLRWYEQNKRALPFRTVSTPYRVWVSEIMLQQTRASAALPYFERFMAELPTVADLAACDHAQGIIIASPLVVSALILIVRR